MPAAVALNVDPARWGVGVGSALLRNVHAALAERGHRRAHQIHPATIRQARIQHGALLISFITLVLTGFALRFPDV